jgi:pimeloyl-ACP methyl ester carboxylesterase
MDATWQFTLLGCLCLPILLGAAGALYERAAERRERLNHVPPGRMVQLGTRELHLVCKGMSAGRIAPSVVIEQGAGEPCRYWWAIQERVSHFATVCTYDRAGFGWSVQSMPGRTIEDRADELHALLAAAGVPGPYVLVAHSYGGLIVRRFAAKYPQSTAGMVLVDTPEEAALFRAPVLTFYRRMRAVLRFVQALAAIGALRIVSRWYNLEAFGFPYVRPGEYAAAADDLDSLEREDAAMRVSAKPGSLGALPLAVVTHGIAFPGPFAFLEEGWRAGQERLAALSSRGHLIVARESSHMIQLDEPDLIVDAIRGIHSRAARS